MILHRLNPERAHNITVRSAQLAGAVAPLGWLAAKRWGVPAAPLTVMGLAFRNRVGLAAGFDKDGLAAQGLARLGLGHIEVGTVTLRPQAGNDKPRVFRLDDDASVINRMGFPSRGADFVAQRLATTPPVVVGVNIGKGRNTPLDAAVTEYVALTRRFASLADYLAVNVSSPNTPGLRRLQRGKLLHSLLTEVAAHAGTTPVAAKLGPDLEPAVLDEVVDAIDSSGIDAIIATNTTTDRPHHLRSGHRRQAGGLSGAALRDRAAATLEAIAARTALPIIAVGGIMSGDDAAARIRAGASLIQVYTGLVYRGPRLLRELVAAPER